MAKNVATSDIPKVFAERVKTRRMKLKMSMRDLAEQCGVTHSAISYIEQGTGSTGLVIAIKLSKVLGFKLDSMSA